MATLNTAISPSPVVTVLNKDGTTATGYTGNVTMALGTNPTGATLGGTTTVAASSGVATFSNLTLNRSGKNFTLRATAAAQGGVTPRARVSSAFTISTQLVFTTQPSSTQPDTTFTVEVTAQDTAGNTDTSYTGSVTIAIYTATAAGVLSGTLTQTAVAGVATFSSLSINLEGTYSLRAIGAEVATAYPPAPAVSDSFAISEGYTLTAADIYSDGTAFGKLAAGPGSITPASFGGLAIRNVISTPGTPDFVFSTSGAPAQNLFTSITINGNTYLSASATFVSPTWTWNTAPISATGDYVVVIV